MKYKRVIVVMAVLLLGLKASAAPVDPEVAGRVAVNFWNAHRDAGVAALAEPMQQLKLPFDGMYLFTAGERGFVLVADDDRVPPILGYSFSSPATGELNPEVAYWLGIYQGQMAVVRGMEGGDRHPDWDVYSRAPQGNPVPLTAVSPLLTTQWSQKAYYNDLCPFDTTSSYNNHVPVGCTAAAMAQVMKYWSHPTTGTGSHSYTHSTYGTLSANFGATTYDWNNMPDSLNALSSAVEVLAVATLMYHAGVATEMRYGSTGSGAYLVNYNLDYANLPSAQGALPLFFNYSDSIEAVYRHVGGMTDDVWKNYIKHELDAARPVLYAGYDTSSGHTFVCDGYNTNATLFHFNWGWGGNYDGYFSLNDLTIVNGMADTVHTFNLMQQILVNVKPASAGGGGGYIPPDPGDNCLMTEFPYVMYFDDDPPYYCTQIVDANGDGITWTIGDTLGSGGSQAAYVSHAPGADDWLLLPGIATEGTYRLLWYARARVNGYSESYEVYAGDSLIYSDSVTSTMLNLRFLQFNVPAGDTVWIKFRYTGDDQMGLAIDDISVWAIQPPEQYTITLLSNNDEWGTVSGGGVYDEGVMAILRATPYSGFHFVEWNDGNPSTDRWALVTGDATYIAYFAPNDGIDDREGESTWSVYPNPATDAVAFGGVDHATVTVTDLTGRTVATCTVGDGSTLDVSAWPSGTYFFTLATDGATAVRKIIIKH